MRHNPRSDIRFFFTTQPLACPYVDGLTEKRMVTELSGRDAVEISDRLSLSGFRRSHTVAYIPVCDNCNSCVSVRILAREFSYSRSHRKIKNRNRDINVSLNPPIATHEQFSLFKEYTKTRHGDGDMATMDYYDYQSLIEDTPVRTNVVEFRNPEKQLIACCIVDKIKGGISAVYSFYSPDLDRLSLGTFIILWLIEYAYNLGLDHVYLGYWVNGSRKMDYKKKFYPLEGYIDGRWLAIQPETAEKQMII
ncbi:MAG: arginyltransferase [Rhodospirillaceae bacterium]|nr:arginyltransferase [Rhodospirillaceae bacterium]